MENLKIEIESLEIGGINLPENSSNNIADPKRVLAALQELSRSRKRNRHGRRQMLSEEDEEEEDDDVGF